jgi:hypothetical protein
LASLSYEGLLKIWDVDKGISVQSFDAYRSLAMNSIKKQLLIGIDSEDLIRIKPLYGNSEKTSTLPYLNIHPERSNSLIVLKNGDLITFGQSITVWNVSRGVNRTSFKSEISFPNGIRNAVLLNNGDLATSGYENNVLIWNTEKGVIRRMLSEHHINGTVRTLALLKSGDLVSGTSVEIIIWNVTTWSVKRVINESSYALCALTSGYFANIGYSDSENSSVVQIWDSESGDLIRNIYTNVSLLNSKIIELSNGDLVLSAFNNSQTNIEIWDPSSGLLKQILLSSNYSHNNCFALMANNRLAISIHDNAYDSGKIQIWDTESGIHQRTLSGHNGAITSLVVMNDGRLASSGQDRLIRLWNI